MNTYFCHSLISIPVFRPQKRLLVGMGGCSCLYPSECSIGGKEFAKSPLRFLSLIGFIRVFIRFLKGNIDIFAVAIVNNACNKLIINTISLSWLLIK
jgi:hypothetical protein